MLVLKTVLGNENYKNTCIPSLYFTEEKQPFLLKKRVNVEIEEDEDGTTKWYIGVVKAITDGVCTISFDGFDSSHNIQVPEDEIPSEDIILL